MKLIPDLSPLLHEHAVLFPVAIALVAILLGLANSWIKQNLWKRELRHRKLFNHSEQEFFRLLVSTLPDKVILAQVSYNALVTARRGAVRARFNRLYADFVVCDPKDFSVEAIIELDGPTHETSAGKLKDKKRDKILKSVGYRVERFSTRGKLKGEDIINRFSSATT